jgi:hypothetical protein
MKEIQAGPASMGAVVTLPSSPASDGGLFIDSAEFRRRVPVSRRTEFDWRDKGLLPFIRPPDGRRILYHWPTVLAALRRMQQGGAS